MKEKLINLANKQTKNTIEEVSLLIINDIKKVRDENFSKIIGILNER